MAQSHREASRRLFEFAEQQQGFFTTKQAKAAGFAENTHPYHVQVGNWVREYRGIYRLALFPTSDRPDLVLWALWSRNRNEEIEGVYSHDTALSLYDLSDLNPAKLHMTVPTDFRRSSDIPGILVLHYADLPESDIQTAQGFKRRRRPAIPSKLEWTNGSLPDSTWTLELGTWLSSRLETIACRDWLGFAGIEKSRVRMIAREQQFAEKIHAYTLPRNAPNSRVKDLVDMALLIGSDGLNQQRILDALRLTFERRETHDLPAVWVPPPADWQIPFQALSEECGLPTDVAAVFAGVQAYFEQLLAQRTDR